MNKLLSFACMTFLKDFWNVIVTLALISINACSHTAPQRQATQNIEGKKLRVASVQYKIEGNHSLESLVAKIQNQLEDAKKQNVELIVYPEQMIFDTWPLNSDLSDAKISQQIMDKYSLPFLQKAKELSKRYNISILLGSQPRLTSKNKIRNTAYLILPSGQTYTQDKVFLTAWERRVGWEDGEKIQAFDTPWGKTAILICYDTEFPLLSQQLSSQLPELILVPSMTESESGRQRVRWTAQARAVEHHAFVILSSTVGHPQVHWQHFGQSAIISPRDPFFTEDVIQKEKNKPEIVYADLDFKKLRESRKESDFYPDKDEDP